MIDLTTRSTKEEIMDDLESSGPVIEQTLRELETINTLLGGNYVTIDGVEKLLNPNGQLQSFTIADLGCGGGDIMRLIDHWAKRKNYSVKLIGFDANPHIVDFAKKHSQTSTLQFESQNIFSEDFRQHKFDVVIGTLFFHHFTSDQLTEFLKQLKKQVRVGIVINDLHRHWFAYYSIKWLTHFFSKSPMVKYDAPLSVARGFRKNELQSILEQAGFKNFSVRWMWAFRWQVIIPFTANND